MAEQSTLRYQVWARGAREHYFESLMPMVIPRVGDRVEFADGFGVVDEVTWEPDRSRKRNADMLIVVMCSPETRREAAT